ncbi:transposase [Brucella pseudogrignonensis]|uniref:Transposase n=1 Tax=Brucella pseudogrignonensis TaxID=419475 RepID=A0ABU1MBM6_9HYPH|nr:transposase [Brucella pseudogrignonensis]MDR6433440.1 putative transposase [Brucella pseudogrignonensis]
MADENTSNTNSTVTETPATVKSVKPRKTAAKAAPVAEEKTTAKRKKYTPEQRASIMSSIEAATKNGKQTLKAALQQAEVSEQTYYNWKNAAEKVAPTSAPKSTPKSAPKPASKAVKTASGDDLASLVSLEAENNKLRKELATKLREENAELRRRLGKL